MTETRFKTVKDMTQWDLVEIILQLKSEDRERQLIEQVLPWFRDRSAFFRMLEEGKRPLFLMFLSRHPSVSKKCKLDYIR